MTGTALIRRIRTWVVVGSLVGHGLLVPALVWAEVLSTVEINDGTANGPVLNDSDQFGTSVANIGDLDGDGVSDLAVGAF